MRVLFMRGSLQRHSRSIGLGVSFALLGFCLALASGLSDDSSARQTSGDAARVVGSSIPLKFTNPLVVAPPAPLVGTMPPIPANEFDLGDACFGSTIVRYVTAEGGLRPYRFKSSGTNNLASIIANTGSTLVLGISGVLAGSTPGSLPSGIFPSPYVTILKTQGLHFPVTVTDSFGTNPNTVTANFNLFLFNSATTYFRFGTDTLPNARLDSTFSAHVDVLNGKAPVKISALSVTDATGAAVKLSDLGLYFGTNGNLMGKPLRVGTFTLNVRATDANNALAHSRKNQNANDQVMTLVVLDYPVTSSDAFAIQCSVKGYTGISGKDSLHYKGAINNLGNDQLALAGTAFSFSLGGVSFSGKLDKSGNYTAKLADKSSYSFKVNARAGSMDVKISKSSFLSGLELAGLTNGTLRRTVQIVLGDLIISSEVLDFTSQVDGTKYALNYQIGKKGVSASGGFEVVSVKGKDDVALNGLPGDAWRVGFLAQPRAGVTNPTGLLEGFDNIVSINVRIGSNFAQKITGGGIIGAGPAITFVGGAADGVKSFKLDAKTGKGSIQTRTLAFKDTAIPQAAQSLALSNIFFQLGVDLNRASKDATYMGEHARKIFNLGKYYSDTPPRRLTTPVPH